MPIIYALSAGVILNVFSVPIPTFIWVPANYIADAMIALSLVTLGAQVAKIQLRSGLATVYLSLLIRLITSPIIALNIIFIFNLDGILAQALFIASAMPTSVNSSVIAQEYDNYPNLAA